VVGILVAVALLPMQDPLSLVLMSGPLYVLYELSILGGRLVERRRRSEGDGAPRAARRDEERP
jgi:Sec-independent protein secretion pathway component TatC